MPFFILSHKFRFMKKLLSSIKRGLSYGLFVSALALSASSASAQSTSPAPYCTPVATYGGCQLSTYITNVEVLDASSNVIWSNSSGCQNYTYYNNLSNVLVLEEGKSYKMRLTVTTGYNLMHGGAWIDFDGNNDFYGTNEYVGGTAGSPTFVWAQLNGWGTTYISTRTFDMPTSGLTTRLTRMRLRSGYQYDNFYGDPCNSVYYPETEDYDVLVLKKRSQLDITPVRVNNPSSFCGSTNDSIRVGIINLSSNGKIAGVTVGAKVTGTIGTTPVNAVYTKSFGDSLPVDYPVQVAIAGINTANGVSLTITPFVKYPGGDSIPSNDTGTAVIWNALGTPVNAVASQTDVYRCGVGKLKLSSTQVASQNSLWWTQASGGTLMNVGDTFNTPTQTVSQTYYIEKVKFGPSGDLGAFSNYSYYQYYAGGFFNITTGGSPILLDSVIWFCPSTTATDVSVYYRTGPYGGYETNATSWTLLNKTTGYVPKSGSTGNTAAMGMIIPANSTYGFFIFSNASSSMPYYKQGGTVSDASISIYSNSFSYGVGVAFNSYTTGIGLDLRAFYRRACVSSSRVAVNANVKRIPTGASLSKAAVFNGTYRSGTPANFDHVKAGDQNQYDLVAPTGFNNADHNTTWKVMSVSVTKPSGAAVASTLYSFANPTASGPGKFIFKPNATLYRQLDSAEYHHA